MLFYIFLLLFSNPFACNADELIDLKRVKEWAHEFNNQINLINSYACVNQIHSAYDAKAEITTIKPKDTLKYTVDGINKLFTNKNNTLHKLVDDAQSYASIYSQEAAANRLKNKTRTKSKSKAAEETDEDSIQNSTTNSPEVNQQLTTANSKQDNQNLSTYFKSVDYPTNYEINQTKFAHPNEVVGNDNEYNQLTTTTTTSTNDVVENQGEGSINKESYRLSFNEDDEDDFDNYVVSEEESILNQLENDKRLNESLNRANYLTTTPRTTAENDTKETNDVMTKEDEEKIENDNQLKPVIDNDGDKDADSKEDDDDEEEDDFLYFKDTKKIYSPDKPLSNLSIPREIPDNLNEKDEDKKKEYKERWMTWSPVKTIKHGLFPNYRVNFSFSGLHVPLNVYPQHENIKDAIKWSDRLDETFKENRKLDPYLNFQFFCSNDGFLRVHPMPKWRVPELFSNSEKFLDDNELEEFEAQDSDTNIEQIDDLEVDENDPSRALDLYDCRLRDWYVKAAAAPKDVIVLLDSSGSMRGERTIIGLNVLINILETLTENDYVSIVRFNDKILQIDDCFKTDFVQANRRNVAKFKARILELGHEEMLELSEEVANYTTNIEAAFNLLKKERNGSNCNKIMMLVTDGDLDNMDSLFKKLNNDSSIRVFTFLVGREVMSPANTESIACKNHGYFTHLKDLAEVKEEVQLYVPVLSRSIGLRIFDEDATLATTFSSIYSDQVYPNLNAMTWERFENKKFENYEFRNDLDKIEPELMITMSMPVFNITNGTQTSWDLIGVVGLDIPISEILNEIPFYRLGVNGHAFIINNNGFLIYHPDMRPLYKGFLKSFYTSLDILEVELVDDGKEARDENKRLLGIRQSMIDGGMNCDELDSKFHYYSMTRASTRKHLICWRPIPNTLFSIAISIPSSYGPYSVHTPFKIEKNVDYSNYFDLEGSEWSVHPKWTYCWDNLYNKDVFSNERTDKILLEMTPKEIIEHFLKTNQLDSSSFSLQDYLFNEENENLDSKFFCNEELVSSLIFDANATKMRLGSCPTNKFNTNLKPINAFISTRSGLTRFFDFDRDGLERSSNASKRELSIDEDIYKKAVDYSVKYESNGFVFQLERSNNRTFITAAKALILTHADRRKKTVSRKRENNKNRVRTPYAVVGMQFDYDEFLSSIKKPNFRATKPTRIYFVDDNGYVLFGFNEQNQLIKDESNKPSGLLLSEYDRDLFNHLKNQKIFKSIKLFDYQAICEKQKPEDGDSSSASSLLSNSGFLINFLFKSFAGLIREFSLFIWLYMSSSRIGPVYSLEEAEDADGYFVAPPPNRTKIEGCRKDLLFYELNRSALSKEPKLSNLKRENDETDWSIVYRLPKTNLLIVITSDDYEPKKEPYVPSDIIFEKTKCDRDVFHRRSPYMYKGPVCYPNDNENNIQYKQACGSSSNSGTLSIKLSTNLNVLCSSLLLLLVYKLVF